MDTVRAVERAMIILELFKTEEKPLKLNEISAKTALTNATALRIMRSMEKYGYVVYDEKDSTYFAGNALLGFFDILKRQNNMKDMISVLMKKYSDLSGETINLYVKSTVHRICIEQVESKHALTYFSKIGDIKPLLFGASGKVLLAFSPQDTVDEVMDYYLSEEEKEDFKNWFFKELEMIREIGYGVSAGERAKGIMAVSVPIFDSNGSILYSISLAGPIERIVDKKDYYGKKMIEFRDEIII